MQVPAILYGEVKDVRRRCKEALRQWLWGAPYIAAMEASGVYDVADFPQPIKLERHRSDWALGLYVSMPVEVLMGENGLLWPKTGGFAWDDPRLAAFFDACLTRPWALLSLLAAQDARLLFGPLPAPNLDRYRRYVAAVLRDCDVLEAVGPRYIHFGAGPSFYLAQQAYAVYGGVQALGWPITGLTEIIGGGTYEAKQPPGGLRGVLQHFGAVIDPAWAGERLPDQPTVLPAPPPPPAPRTVDPDESWMSEEMEQAIEADDRQTIKRLVAAGESPERINGGMETAFSWALRHGDTELVIYLLGHGAQVEGRGPEGESPLMIAAAEGHMAIVRLLLERGAKVRYRSPNGWDARSYARMGGHPEIEALLLEAWKGGAHRRQAISGQAMARVEQPGQI